jgi:hypothetical protein
MMAVPSHGALLPNIHFLVMQLTHVYGKNLVGLEQQQFKSCGCPKNLKK